MTVTLNPFESDQTEFVPIGTAYSVTLGKMLDAGKAVDDSYTVLPYIRAANIQDDGLRLTDVNEMPFSESEAARLDLRRGDLLVVEGGAVGTNTVLDQDMPGWSFQKTVNRVRPIGDWSTRYLGYVLRAYRDAGIIDLVCNGSTISHLTAEKLRALRIPSARPGEQYAIADYLDRETARIDTIIEEQQRLIEMLRDRRWAVVERGVALLDWNTPFKTVATLIQTGPFGSQLKSAEYLDGGIPVINPSHIVAGEVVPDPRIAVSAEKAEQLARHKLEEGDLIAARRGDLGRCAVVGPSEAGFLCGTGSAVIRLDRARMDPSFAATLFSSRRNRDALALASVGSTMENLNSDIIGALRFPVPTLDEQRALTADLEQATAKIDQLIAEAELFIELSKERRSALITAAVTGQIDVGEMV